VGKPEEGRPLRRPRRRWEDGIRMDLREMGWGWIGFYSLRIGAGGDKLSGSCATELVNVRTVHTDIK
jgi:hypothetical protein